MFDGGGGGAGDYKWTSSIFGMLGGTAKHPPEN